MLIYFYKYNMSLDGSHKPLAIDFASNVAMSRYSTKTKSGRLLIELNTYIFLIGKNHKMIFNCILLYNEPIHALPIQKPSRKECL